MEKRVRKIVREILSEVMLNESDSLMIQNFPYDQDELESLGDISHYIVRKVAYDLLPKLEVSGEERDKMRGFADDFSPDGGEYFNETGMINFYPKVFPISTYDKIIGYIKWILAEKDIKVGDIKKETFGEKFSEERMEEIGAQPDEVRVIRIPIIKNESPIADLPPEINLSSSTWELLFRDLLNYESLDGSFSATDILMRADTAKKALATSSSIPEEPKAVQHGNIFSSEKDKKYLGMLLNQIEKFAQWTLDRGYHEIYVA